MHLVSQFRALRPGGWLELCDYNYPMVCFGGAFPQDSALYCWNMQLIEASEKLGVSLACVSDYPAQMTEAGFVRVRQHEYQWPLGTWGIGAKNQYIGKQPRRGGCAS